MSKDFYALLEICTSASSEAIKANYQRLQARYAALAAQGDEDATNFLIALREAYGTLADPERRRRYDERLVARTAEPVAREAARGGIMKWLVLLAIIGATSVGFARYQTEQEKLRLQHERELALAAEQKAAAEEKRRANEERLAEQQAERQRQRDADIERAQRERDIAYGNQVSRNIQQAESQARYEKQRDEQRQARLEQEREREQKLETERQLAREKAYLRQVEAENNRTRRW